MRALLAGYLASLSLLAAFAVAGGVILFRESGPGDGVERVAYSHAYNVVSWELRHLPGKWLYKVGGFLGRTPDAGSDEQVLARYFQLTEQIRAAEGRGDVSAAEQRLSERYRLQNRVEEILEGRVTRILEDEGLAMRPPIFSDLGLIFPPVDFKLDSPPRVLAVSPRDRIELADSYLLSAGLPLSTVLEIESEAEKAGAHSGHPEGVSALVITTGGVATYPSVVSELASYESLVPTVIHEWIHQYLVFFPLGRSYFSGREARTINESVASLAGRALADAYFARYGRLTTPAPALSAAPAQDGFDFRTEMRELRLRVEELLAGGEIERAERLMERRRQEFAERGVYIRRLNQAYFAFHGTYADRPASIDPVGPKLETVFERAGSPGEFLRLVSGVTSERELDGLLAETGG